MAKIHATEKTTDTLTGVVDGSNRIFTATIATPDEGSVQMKINVEPEDYTMISQKSAFLSSTPQSGDTVIMEYDYNGPTPTPGPASDFNIGVGFLPPIV